MKPFTRALVVLTALIIHSNATAGSWNTNKAGVVLDGYDVVAYHTLDRPVKGSEKFAATFDGATFHFANAANLEKFKGDPAHYAPKFNAYCAFAAGHHNAKVPANADTFKLYNGKLLVFFNDVHEGQKFNTKIPWNADEQALYTKAVENWQTLEDK